MDSRNDYGFGPSVNYDDVSYGDRGSSFGWNMFLFAVAVAMIAVNWGFLRPASRQLDQLQSQIKTLEKTVAQLAKQKSSAKATTDLLTLLENQGRHTESAAASLTRIQQLHNRLINETSRYNDASVALHRLSTLRQEVSEQSTKIEATKQALQEIAHVQRHLLAISATSTEAESALDRVETIHQRIVQSGDTVLQTELLVDDVDSLHRHLLSTSVLHSKAQQVADKLVEMSEILAEEGPYSHQARSSLDDLVSLRDAVDEQSMDLDQSQSTLDQMIELKDRVLSQTPDIADAIVTLEQTADLNEQFQQASRSFETWRRWLTDVVLMEPTIRRAMESLEPLASLGNLRRISPGELRQAAQVVLDIRREELAKSGGSTDVAVSTETDTSR